MSHAYQIAIVQPRNRGLGVLTLLSWLAAVEGNISPQQLKVLRNFANKQVDPAIFELALQVAMQPTAEDLRLACEVIQKMPEKGRRQFVHWGFAVATADKEISIGANYLLRFFIDLADIGFVEACDRAKTTLPMPPDVGSLVWWQDRPGAKKKKDSSRPGSAGRNAISVEEAYEMLGVSPTATTKEVSAAFRKLASLHHPDRHAQASEQEQRKAAKKFARLREAFELLTSS